MSNESDTRRHAEAVLQFNRFYRKFLGTHVGGLPPTPYSLTEMRILRELASNSAETAAALARNLSLDSGYLSRILTGFEQRALIAREPSKADARQTLLRLTEGGRAAYAALATAAVGNIENVLARLTKDEQARLVEAMRVVQQLLS